MSPFESYKQVLEQSQPVGMAGRVSAVRGLTVSVSDFPVPVGASCRIQRGADGVEARVIGFGGDQTLIMPMGAMTGICRGDRVVCTSTEQTVGVGEAMLGRMVSALGRPVDYRGDLRTEAVAPIWPGPIGPMQRRRISEPLPTGVRAIDAMLTVGRGQRMGIFSGSGVGKSVLLGMIGRYTSADVNVIALIGERGREVRDFVERDLGEEGLARSVVVVATADEPPLLRVQAGAVAAAIAEYFRDKGRDVLLLVDSITRLAMAQRQIGLVAGEPPATRGYTPSVFNLLPELLERSGRTDVGSVTGFYTVLVEGDDMADPIGDAVRATSDGHIWLERHLANRGHYPAIDVLHSVSRAMMDVADPTHLAEAAEVRRLLTMYADVEELVNIGAYHAGASPDHDLAIRAAPEIRAFLVQSIHEPAAWPQTMAKLHELSKWIARQKDTLKRRQVNSAVPAA